MTKKYFYITLITFFMFSLSVMAQESKGTITTGKEAIEGLNIYPNPASADRIYITTAKPALSKEIEIFDVLGKKMLQATLNGKELNISGLAPGMYIIKIKEGDATATKKLVVK